MWAWTRFRGESWRRRLFVRRLVRAGLVAVLLAVILPAAFIGANCYPIGQKGGASAAAATTHSDMARFERAEAFTYLTLPQWFMVYSADEYAQFADRGNGSPSDFPYFS